MKRPSCTLFLCLTLAGCLSAVAPAKAGPTLQDKYPYLVEALNNLNAPDPGDPEKREKDLLAAACQTLTLLQKDEGFFNDLKGVLDKAKPEQLGPLRKNLWTFTQEFLVKEDEVLQEQGVNEDTRKGILASATFFNEAISYPISMERVRNALDTFQKETCSREATAIREERNQDVIEHVKGLVALLADTLVEKISPSLALASVNLGTHMIEGNRMVK